jgi:protein TonB
MKLVSFFVFSLFLHAAALVYPVSFSARSRTEMISIRIFPMEPEGGGGEPGQGGTPARRDDLKAKHREPKVEPKSGNPEPQNASDASVHDSGIAWISAAANSPAAGSAAIADPTGGAVTDSGSGLGGSGDGSGSSGGGFGRDSGSGTGSGSSRTGIALTQARYRDTPRPEYPDSARREGREGRVLLRVLVDDQGRSKKVEINSSSGSEALDRAAAEAIKRWRFHPARHGDNPVESWLRIPIEFHLADAKSR